MQHKKVVQMCDKVLKKQMDLQAGKALKALALTWQQTVSRGCDSPDSSLQSDLEKPVDKDTPQAMTMYVF